MAKSKKKFVEQYDHASKRRKNISPVGLVTPDNDKDGESKVYEDGSHLDPKLQWASKAEHTSFEVPTVSLFVAVEKEDTIAEQPALFETPEENPPLRQAIDFYERDHSRSDLRASSRTARISSSDSKPAKPSSLKSRARILSKTEPSEKPSTSGQRRSTPIAASVAGPRPFPSTQAT